MIDELHALFYQIILNMQSKTGAITLIKTKHLSDKYPIKDKTLLGTVNFNNISINNDAEETHDIDIIPVLKRLEVCKVNRDADTVDIDPITFENQNIAYKVLT